MTEVKTQIKLENILESELSDEQLQTVVGGIQGTVNFSADGESIKSTGSVKFFNADKGFGFIDADGN